MGVSLRARDDRAVAKSCEPEAGLFEPRIDRNRCEAKAACVRVCPYDVFEIRPVPQEERRQLSFIGRMKVLVHGGKQAYAVRAAQCRACGLCVRACPEDAITLVDLRSA